MNLYQDTVAARDYLVSEFPLAFNLLQETRQEAYNFSRKNYRQRIQAIDYALNAAVEYGALRCLARLLRESPEELLKNFIADDEEFDPEEDSSDELLLG